MRNYLYFPLFFLTACNSVFYQGDKKSWHRHEPPEVQCSHSTLTSSDGTLLMTMRCPPATAQRKGVIVQFHGNAQNMSAHHQLLSWLVAEGYTLETFDYRGYGDSGGESSREGIWLDARAYIQDVRRRNPDQLLVFYGQSLGGAVMMRALIDEGLSKDEIYIFEGTFLSYQRVARTALAGAWFLWPFQWLAYILVSDSYAPGSDAAVFGGHNVLLLHGERDPVVPVSHGEQIARVMQIQLSRIPGGRHLDTWLIGNGKLRAGLVSWLEANRATPPRP